MKLIRAIVLVSLLVLSAGCRSQGNQEQTPSQTVSANENHVSSQSSDRADSSRQEEETDMQLTINGQAVSVDWADNPTVTALYQAVRQAPLEIRVRDYASMEKVGELPQSLPSSNQQMNTDAGDITLFNGRSLALYYDRNSYSLTPIGKIQGMSKDEIRQLLTSQEEMTVRIGLGSDRD